MSREWKPGDVAMVSEIGQHERVAIRDTHGWAIANKWNDHSHSRWIASERAVVVRPLVVIDPEDREQIERLYRLYYDLRPEDQTVSRLVESMQAALREFADPTPPKPDEPTGLGAVVEDAEGHKWVRDVNDRWWCAHREPNTTRRHFGNWSMVPAVRVLSEGVQR